MGCKEARRRIGVNATGLAFNSVMAVELNKDRTMNSTRWSMPTAAGMPMGLTGSVVIEACRVLGNRSGGQRHGGPNRTLRVALVGDEAEEVFRVGQRRNEGDGLRHFEFGRHIAHVTQRGVVFEGKTH